MKTRLQRYLADCGVASRRECEELIKAGRVRVNGEVRTEMPVMVDPEKDIITLDEEVLEPGAQAQGLHEQDKVYYLLNKPKGILVTNYDPADRKTVSELMAGVRERVFPVGRLDMDSRGALIMTNDGELANRLTHPRYGIEKTYIVEVEGNVSAAGIEKIKRGIWLGPERGPGGGEKTERFKVKLVGRERGRTIIEVKLSEGRNREIRRVMARIGNPVRDLNRVAIAGKVTIAGLKVGEFRKLTDEEVKWLFYASSEEHQAKQRQATQQWYEQKEMDKERKRLAREEAAAAPTRHGTPSVSAGSRSESRTAPALARKPGRVPPVRKGRKPFVPPSGRNAGKLLGGNKLGRRNFEKQVSKALHAPNAPRPENHLTQIRNEIRMNHPLGDMARRQEE